MRTCAECGAEVHAGDRFCPVCGVDLAAAEAAARGSLFEELMTDGRAEEGEPVQDEREEASHSGLLGVLLVSLGALLLVAGIVWVVTPRSGGDGSASSAAPATRSSGTPTPSPASADESSASPSPARSSATMQPPRDINMTHTASRCPGAGDGVTAYSGNEVTSCAFAVEVAEALAARDPKLPATLTVRSPVTTKRYTMTCDNTAPVECRGGTDALVYVALPEG
ncbi:zinc ribbon domain-containing protein [Phycicoccus endophyticus]|uniref:Zinc ribbon domain-containing protein n=1 Tax=Phycicoccus endophyticus TaxID=1690220 RepID=A0A7G9R219_9MICO|nr:zinc ribbon domain-containing protein [Phycicoccus endophyticus]NHI19716.1 hypothetical protein [Phycicoccus endophyticus]QNN49644.1 zinc ribbon domain-containing protein [Phycicoccus endophyticus]GGL33619.1 hypothetical protein GCM10012283_15120 [Phycicoccus endophyticus]